MSLYEYFILQIGVSQNSNQQFTLMTVKAIETALGISNNDMICEFIVSFFLTQFSVHRIENEWKALK